MSNVKISALPAATTPLTGTELVPLVQSGVTSQVAVSNIKTAPAGSNTQVQFNNASAFGASASLTWDGTSLTATKLAGAHNGTVGATTPSTGAFTTLSATGTITSTKDGVLFERSGATTLAQQIHVANTGSDCYFGAEKSGGSGILNGSTSYAFCINQVNNTPVQIGSNNVVVATFKQGGSLALENATTSTGCGITFPATQSASTDANTLDDYEEGTWTPGQGAGLTVVGAYTSSGKYVKIGRQVFVSGVAAGATTIAASANSIGFTGLPFASSGTAGIGSMSNASLSQVGATYSDSTNVYVTAMTAAASLVFSLVYHTT